ncbi:MAG: hypothetical protein ABH889_00710 [Candidatus Portnoybacteria bacterium]
MKRLKLIVLLSSMVWLVNCASTKEFIPKHAIINPAKGISIPHPVELEKAGIKVITTFQGIMDSGLWVEVINAGGVWPFLAKTPFGEILDGYVYLAGVNYWGDWQLQFISMYNLEELKEAKILLFNRDAGFCYQLNGKQVEYDPKKFDSDEKYQKKIFQDYGWTLKKLDLFWLDYLKEKGLNPPDDLSSLAEIKIGSDEWNRFKGKIVSLMKYDYKMSNGEIRCGYLPLESFRQVAVEIPGFNGIDRYLKRAKVPLFALPLAGAGLLVTAGASVLGDAVAAGADSSWSGSYARAQVIRYQMVPLFRQMTLIYKELLIKRDQRIMWLEKNINDLEFKLIIQD